MEALKRLEQAGFQFALGDGMAIGRTGSERV